MFNKFKNIFKSLFKKKIIFIVLLFTIIGTTLPVSTFATGWDTFLGDEAADFASTWIFPGPVLTTLGNYGSDKIDSVAQNFTDGISNFFVGILLAIPTLFLLFCHSLLDWIVSSSFINISFTGVDNIIVQQGWTMVRDFTNMFIVLGFVVIALATILRIREYHAQKLLPLLIGIALLINFTPVICGFVIDVSNIVMNHFLNVSAPDTNFINAIESQTAAINGKDVSLMQKIIGLFVYAIFSIIAGIIYLLFAALFLFRYIALWILIILSPLAFFCYILPATKSVWNLWWKQFFQWCIIGIPAAFFIYLSNTLLRGVAGNHVVSLPGGKIGAEGFAVLFSYIIPIAFLFIGFLVSLQTGAMGASVVTKATSGAVKGTVKWAGKKGGTGAKFLGREGMSKVLSGEGGEKVRKWAERQAMRRTPGAGEKGLLAKAKWVTRAPDSMLRRGIGKIITPLPEGQRRIADEAGEKAKTKDYVENTNTLNSTIDSDKKVGILSTMIDKNQLGDALKSGQITKNQMLDIHRHAIKMKDKNKYEKFERAYIKDGGDEMEKIAFEEGIVTEIDLAKKGHKNYQEKIIAGAKKPDELKQLQKGWHENPELLESFERTADGGKLGKMCDVGGKDFVDTHQKFVDKNGPKWYLKPENYNISMINYHNSPAAVSVGLSTMTGGNKIKDDNDVSEYSEGEQQSLKQIQDMRKGNIDEATNKAKKAVGEILKDEKGVEIKEIENKKEALRILWDKNKKEQEDKKGVIKANKGKIEFETDFAKLQSQTRQMRKEFEKINKTKGTAETKKFKL